MIEETVKVSFEKRVDNVAVLMHERLANQNGEAEDAGLPDLRWHGATQFQQIFHFQKQSLGRYFDMHRQFHQHRDGSCIGHFMLADDISHEVAGSGRAHGWNHSQEDIPLKSQFYYVAPDKVTDYFSKIIDRFLNPLMLIDCNTR